MSIDPNRYALITEEYRWAELGIAGVASVYAKARTLEIETAFSSASGLPAIATLLSAVVGSPKRRLEVIITGTDAIDPDEFDGDCPCITLTVPSLSVMNETFAITRMVLDEDNNKTALEVWGGFN